MKVAPWHTSLGIAALALQALVPGEARVSQTDPNDAIRTVDFVDLERYGGLWYEIAKIPNRFQKQCVRGTTATYTLREDGRLDVVNRCLTRDGTADAARGVARIVDPTSNAKLEVSFVSFLGWRPFWGDYWILGLDEHYQWAVVGTPSREYGWILARTPEIDDVAMREVLAVLERNGYDRKAFEMSPP